MVQSSVVFTLFFNIYLQKLVVLSTYFPCFFLFPTVFNSDRREGQIIYPFIVNINHKRKWQSTRVILLIVQSRDGELAREIGWSIHILNRDGELAGEVGWSIHILNM
jgi:hypothetical protein